MKRIHLSLKILTIILVIIIIKSWKEIFYSSIYQAISNRQIKVMFQNRESANYHIKTQALCLLFKWQTWLFSLELVEILISDFTVLIDSFLRFVPRLFLSKRQFRRGTLPHTNHLHNSHNRRPLSFHQLLMILRECVTFTYALVTDQEPRVCQGCTVNGAIFTLDDNDDGSSRQKNLSSFGMYVQVRSFFFPLLKWSKIFLKRFFRSNFSGTIF